MAEDYSYGRDDFAQLLLARHYPERTDHESALIRDFLRAHLAEFVHVTFSVRVGPGAAPNPDLLPGVQRQMIRSTQRRIDVVLRAPGRTVLVEAKTRVGHAVLGQLLSDRQLWLEDHPDEPLPELVAIGRLGTPEDLRVLNDHGITVYLYPASDARAGDDA